MQPHAEIKSLIKERLHFQMSKIVDYSSFFQGNNYGDVSLSPYNTFLLIEIVDKNNQGFWKQLFQYKNRSLINYQNCDNMNDEFRKHKSRGCIFMKNTNEFIVWYQEEIIFCRIEQNQKWKTIQVIQKTPVCSVALSTDEQTLFVCDPILSLYKKQQTTNQIWVCFFQVALTCFYIDGFFLDSACNTFIATYFSTLWIVKNYKNQKIWKLLQCSRIRTYSVLGLFEDQFIFIKDLIIQWNKQSRKILRKYKPTIGTQEIKLHSYNSESKFHLASFNQQLIF